MSRADNAGWIVIAEAQSGGHVKKWIVGGIVVCMAALAVGTQLDRSTGKAQVTSLAAPNASLVVPSLGYSKVLVIVEENESLEEIISKKRTPFLTQLAETYGQATAMDAGYPVECPSLAAYIIMTSGDGRGICDDKLPAAHPIPGPSVFSQVTATGKQWRLYAEDMPGNCAQENDGLFVARHAPSNYYTDLRDECLQRSAPMGTFANGALRDDVDRGTLPELGFVIPNLCHDMHGAKTCKHAVPGSDDWLREAIQAIQAGPDYRAGRLAVLLVWDEGNSHDNRIPFVVISPTTAGVTVTKPATLCSVLATMSDLVGVDPLGCAAQAESLAADFRLAPALAALSVTAG